MKEEVILKVKDLVTAFDTEAGRIRAVEGLSFELKKGQTLGIVGESGCGKSVTALSIMRLLPKPMGGIESGQIIFNHQDIVSLAPESMRGIRGFGISMIFQEPMTALNPVQKIGDQLREVYQLHYPGMNNSGSWDQSVEMLDRVGIPEPRQRMAEYPHQISGGMRQRVMIAMALAGKPDILIADEPTTALDVTIQAQILDLMATLQQDTGMAIVFITHDLGVIAEICDDVLVMYAGSLAEKASAVELFAAPRHPYTMGLLSSIPRLEGRRKTALNTIRGMVPSLYDLPEGCRFQNRCPYAMQGCAIEPPAPRCVGGNEHLASCYLY